MWTGIGLGLISQSLLKRLPGMRARAQSATFSGQVDVIVQAVMQAVSGGANTDFEGEGEVGSISGVLSAAAQAAAFGADGFVPVVAALSASAQAATFSGAASADGDLVSGAVLWFDLSDAASFVQSGGVITQITNKISTTVWSEATNRAAYNATGLNSLPTAVFDGTNDRYTNGADAAVIAALTDEAPHTIYIVGAVDIVDANRAMFGWGDSGAAAANSGDVGISTAGTGRLSYRSANSAGTANNLEATATTYDLDPSVFTFVHAGPGSPTTSHIVDNGTPDRNAASHTRGDVNPNQLSWGSNPRSTPTFFFDGRMSEVRIYNTAHDATTITAITNLLKTKWGIV